MGIFFTPNPNKYFTRTSGAGCFSGLNNDDVFFVKTGRDNMRRKAARGAGRENGRRKVTFLLF